VKKRGKSNKVRQVAAAAGEQLREIREGCNLTMRQVHGQSRKIAERFGIRGYEIVPSRLHLLERGQHIPNMFRLYTLATVYGISIREIFRLFGMSVSGGMLSGKSR
jgi:transcriptional regulator with XRE-family HTH domain